MMLGKAEQAEHNALLLAHYIWFPILEDVLPLQGYVLPSFGMKSEARLRGPRMEIHPAIYT